MTRQQRRKHRKIDWISVCKRAMAAQTESKKNPEEDFVIFTSEEKEAAADWVTCACGMQDDVLKNLSDGEPWDHVLNNLGGNFSAFVENDSPAEALKCVQKITERATMLIGRLYKMKPDERVLFLLDQHGAIDVVPSESNKVLRLSRSVDAK